MKLLACKDCRFWFVGELALERGIERERGNEEWRSQCRRCPPLPRVDESHDEAFGDWPVTYHDQWCGEFKLRDIAGGGVNFDTLQNYSDFEENLAVSLRNMLQRLRIKGWETFCSVFARLAEGPFDPTKRSHIAAVAMRERNIGKTLSQGLIDHLARAGWPFRE